MTNILERLECTLYLYALWNYIYLALLILATEIVHGGLG